MPDIPNKHNLPNKPFAQEFVQNTRDANALLQKELIVNQTEQNLLQQRIQMMREFVGDLPASDPQYNMILLAIQMDQIELNELKVRETSLLQTIEQFQKPSLGN